MQIHFEKSSIWKETPQAMGKKSKRNFPHRMYNFLKLINVIILYAFFPFYIHDTE